MVEIRMSREGAGKLIRLAAFGPGSMFGEIAMLTAKRRSADAWCVRPTVLYELRRDALLELERQSPALYARIMTNLSVHLANRLVVATDFMRPQQ
jgi:CRP-like cAMP-binding protein